MPENATDGTEIRVRQTTLSEVGGLREQYRSEAGCQIVRDSILPRGLADPFFLEVDGGPAGYAAIWNEHFPDRITEFFTTPAYRHLGPALVRALAAYGGASELEVQTNILDGRSLVEQTATQVWVENLLFEEGPETHIDRPGITFRLRRETDDGPDGSMVVEERGHVLGAGGWLTHYNPPYADLYLEVVESARGRGIGSYLVQELRRACSEAGHRVAARCNPRNQSSRRALERGGLVQCGEILVGAIPPAAPDRGVEPPASGAVD